MSINTVKWELLDSKNPNFNLWRATCRNGNSYCETFRKGVDPNLKLHYGHFGKDIIEKKEKKSNKRTEKQKSINFNLDDKSFKSNAYKYAIIARDMTFEDVCKKLKVDITYFDTRLNGMSYFTKKELKKLNKLLGYENIGYDDLRFVVNPELWKQKCHGPLEDSAYVIKQGGIL